MSWEGFGIFIGVLIGGPLVLAAVVVVTIVCAVCSVPVGVVWAIAAMVRPTILKSAVPSWPPPLRLDETKCPEAVSKRAPARGESQNE